jgi:transposase
MTVAAMLEWLKLLRNLPEFQHDRFIHLILDGYATHRCEAVRALALEIRIVLHFIPPGLTDLLQRLDRSLFGALKAEYLAI